MPVAIVTGASRGLGHAIARELATRGWRLVVDARDADALRHAVEDLGTTVDVTVVPGDVTDPRHLDELVAAAQAYGGADLVVANASTLGTTPLPPVAEQPIDDLVDALRTNVVAPLALTQRVLPTLRARRGSIVAITSDAAREAYSGWGGYGASKAALDQLWAILAVEEPDVGVYAFDPGDLRTAMHQDAFPGEDISDRPEPVTVVPALLYLVERRPASGRYTAADLLVTDHVEPAAGSADPVGGAA